MEVISLPTGAGLTHLCLLYYLKLSYLLQMMITQNRIDNKTDLQTNLENTVTKLNGKVTELENEISIMVSFSLKLQIKFVIHEVDYR